MVTGVDTSTQSCKVLTVDAETGDVVRSGAAPHPEGTSVDPRRWWDALLAASGGAPVPDDVDAVGVGGQQHGMVALDEAGEPVHDALLWNDTRSADQAARLRQHWGGRWWAEEIGVVPVASFTATKLAWLADHHPELADRVEAVMLPHDYLTWRLLDTPAEAVTDASDASGTGYWSVPDRAYRPEVLAYAFGRAPRLPRVLEPREAAGETAGGVVVSAGCGDNAGAALGLGLREGEVAVSIGTSGTVFTSTRTDVADPSGGIAGFADARGGRLPLIAVMNCTQVLADTARLLEVDLAGLGRLAESAAPDADGLLLVPFLGGERTPDLPHASGTLLGITRSSYTAANLARAAYLAVALSLDHALSLLRGHDVPVERVVTLGGGARSATLLRTAAALWHADVEVPEPAEYVALGAARQAAWALDGAAEPPTWPRVVRDRVEGTDPGWAADVRGRYAEALQRVYGVAGATF
ncbi:xylulokinase [Nocardioides mangrovicus]|uniref:Xylulose kinase n=1 Tax=Nocardioides mangrovicus TaxID=2478913 RepID=A0A3L8NYT0_9ACTN|nr:xylulokinase [Nocardioides mangrovicus]